MVFPIFAVLSFIVLRLSTRARLRTIVWISLVAGLVGDFAIDLLVTLQR